MRQIYAALLLTALSGAAIGEDALAPPSGERKLFEFSADGVQIYVCRPKGEAQKALCYAWVFDAPEAVLFAADGKQAGTHFKGPAGKLNDGSSVTANSPRKRAPKAQSIPWLLLKVKSHQGTGALDVVQFVRRVDTVGGTEPEGGCDAARNGEIARVPYSATYQFSGELDSPEKRLTFIPV